jgi:1-phosphofructokinase family hexose kinase
MIATLTPNPCIDYNIQVDELVRNQTTRAKGTLLYPGGGGVNVARTVNLLGGVPVTAYGLAGGHIGSLLKSMLDAEKVAHDFLDTGLETRINLLISLTPDRSLVRVNAPGPDPDEKIGEALLKKIAGLTPAPQFVVLGGSLPGKKVPPPIPRDFYARVIDELKKKPEIKVVLDSRELALGHGVDRGPWLVKPNEDEMSRLAGRKQLDSDKDFIAAAEPFIAKYGIEYFVISLGARGAIVVGKNDRFKLTPPDNVALTRVGAGDAFVGGLVWALAKGEPIDVAARYAVTVGTATVLSPASDLFRREEVDKLLPKTVVERL